MAGNTKRRAFYVDAICEVSTNKIVYAETIEAALEQARALELQDFVKILGDHSDSRLQINGVFASDSAFTK